MPPGSASRSSCRDNARGSSAFPADVREQAARPAPLRQSPVSGSEQALRGFLDALGRGAPKYDDMTPQVAAYTRQQLVNNQADLARLGTLRGMSFRAATAIGSDLYIAHFTNGSAEWRIGLVKQGKIGANCAWPAILTPRPRSGRIGEADTRRAPGGISVAQASCASRRSPAWLALNPSPDWKAKIRRRRCGTWLSSGLRRARKVLHRPGTHVTNCNATKCAPTTRLICFRVHRSGGESLKRGPAQVAACRRRRLAAMF